MRKPERKLKHPKWRIKNNKDKDGGDFTNYDMITTLVRLVVLFVLCTLLGFGRACGPSEYKSPVGECCPMCNIGFDPEFMECVHMKVNSQSHAFQHRERVIHFSQESQGSVVGSDCSGDLSTTCKPCTPGTFISEPNGLHNCFMCKICAESQGLYTQSKCTTIKDTICDVLDGYYCSKHFNSQCKHALKHSVCKPGQEIKTPGTKNSDTVCVDCPPSFYSPLGLNCTKWTDCTARNEIETENGSSVKDVTCTPKSRERIGLIFAVVSTSFFWIILYLVSKITRRKLKSLRFAWMLTDIGWCYAPQYPVEESTKRIHNSPEENNEEQ